MTWQGIVILRLQAMNIDWQMLALNIQQEMPLAQERLFSLSLPSNQVYEQVDLLYADKD